MKRGTSGINALIAIDKPCSMTSHDVVNRVRRALGEGRVGHAGTLDPDASGVLVVGVGQATRIMGYLTAESKSYDATIRFGKETTTDDLAGDVTRVCDVPERLSDLVQARAYLATLVGEHDQVPPAFSAISVDGRRAYDRARHGETVELPPKRVTILESSLLAVRDEETLEWDCSFRVSKGCYIRSIARDVGRDLGTAACVSALRRTSSGPIGLDVCLSLEQVADLGPEHILEHALNPVTALGLPVRELSEREREDVICGRSLPNPTGMPADSLCCAVRSGVLMGILEAKGNRLLAKAVFPDGIGGAD